jgi:hypothetical protein
MTINAELVAKYSKICERLKDDTQPIFDSAKLDFEHETMTFGSQKGFGQIKMPVEGWDGKQQPFFVNLNSFLNVVKEFPVLELEGFTFKHGTESSFNIAHLEEDDAGFPDFINSGNPTPLKLGKAELDAIKKCGLFVEVDGQASLNGVFVKDGFVWGTCRNRFCEEKVDSFKEADLALPRTVWETLILDVLGEDLIIDKDNKSFFISNGEEIRIQFSVNSSLTSPDIHSDKFVSSIDHANFIVIDKAVLLQVMNFIQPFVANSPSQRVQLVIADDDTLEIKSEDNNNIISRKIAILEKSGDLKDGDQLWVSVNWIKTILSVLGGTTVKMQIDMTKPAVNITSPEEPATHVVYCRLVAQI